MSNKDLLKELEIKNIITELGYGRLTESELHFIRRIIKNLRLKKYEIILDELIDNWATYVLYTKLERSRYYDTNDSKK